jgi:hypothetical protein
LASVAKSTGAGSILSALALVVPTGLLAAEVLWPLALPGGLPLAPAVGGAGQLLGCSGCLLRHASRGAGQRLDHAGRSGGPVGLRVDWLHPALALGDRGQLGRLGGARDRVLPD